MAPHVENQPSFSRIAVLFFARNRPGTAQLWPSKPTPNTPMFHVEHSELTAFPLAGSELTAFHLTAL